MEIPILIKEDSGLKRVDEPVALGVPFQRGLVTGISSLGMLNSDNQPLPFQAQPLAYWPDKSVKWLLIDFQAIAQANKNAEYHLVTDAVTTGRMRHPVIYITKNEDRIIIDTGISKFTICGKSPGLLEAIELNGRNVLDKKKTRMVFTDGTGREYQLSPVLTSVETEGPIRTTIKIDGHIADRDGSVLANLTLRMSFFAGKGLVRLECTIHNPRRAMHPDGYWDLGEKNSLFFKDFSFHIGVALGEDLVVEWSDNPGHPLLAARGGKVEIYQDSSGGENWDSRNHINRDGVMTNSFRGYKVFAAGKVASEGDRAEPTVSLKTKDFSVSGVIKEFWQNFPKAIEVEGNVLTLRLFPHQHKDLYELQPGEQKTHTIFVDFAGRAEDARPPDWVHRPLIPTIDPKYYAYSGAFSYFVPEAEIEDDRYKGLTNSAIEGSNTFSAKAEIVDEYGWRNYGDIYADHESRYYKGTPPVVSHYNNQYDVIHGALLQYLGTGDPKWRSIMDPLARHVMDIDIYHTDKDKSAYNGGLFWHTNHYANAYTSTHRCYSAKSVKDKNARYHTGGGPSNEHNYTSGLLHYYYLTGDPAAKEAVLTLANWVINMEDGRKTIFKYLCSKDTGLSTQTVSRDYHGPGRGAGNSINALIDAFSITGNKKYLEEADKRIRRCVHPSDDINRRHCDDPEKRWSYVIFLQDLGKYMDFKEERGEADYMYFYARQSLLKYVQWMLENEYIYLEKHEKLEYPTETWAAQELRKANVFLYASKYGGQATKDAFIEKARYFYEGGMKRLLSFESATFTRPIAILLACGSMYSYFMQNLHTAAIEKPCDLDFGTPKHFVPQRTSAVKRAILLLFAVVLLGIFCLIAFVR